MLQQACTSLLENFPQAKLREGLSLVERECLSSVRLSDGLLHARIKGTTGSLYDVYLDLKTWPKTKARCLCGSQFNCEHVAASLLFLYLREKESKPLLHLSKVDIWLKNNAISTRAPLVKINFETNVSDLAEEQISEDKFQWYSQLDGQNDFFAYELGIIIDGHKVNLVPLLIDVLSKNDFNDWQSLSQDHVFKITVGKGRVLPIPAYRLKPLIDFLLLEKNTYNKNTQIFKIKKYQWIIMQEALGALHASLQRQWTDNALLIKLQQFMQAEYSLPISLPKDFQAVLRDYQQYGLAWLQSLRVCGFGGILADDMGLGKTVQTLAHLSIEKTTGRLKKPVLIIAPLSLVQNWSIEAGRFTPNLRVCIYHGVDRQTDVFRQYDIIISTYGLVHKDKEKFLKQQFYYLILDEAQKIKNSRAQITLIIQQIKANYRLGLSGTPFENHLGELWSLMNFVMPGLLFDKKNFKNHFQDPIEKNLDIQKMTSLMARVKPFLLRRSKKDVLPELPEKTIIVRSMQLLDAQRELYEWIRLSMEKKVRESIMRYGMVKSQILFLDALLKLRQVCCDPRLLKLTLAEKAYGTSVKLDALLELVDWLIAEGRSILIFSQFTSMLSLIENAMQARKYSYRVLTGETRNRQQVVDDFQNGKVSIFLMSLKAGGVGLNLTRADTVIHYDPWWNPAVEDQATDRTHRLGQLNPVFVYRLITQGTVEEAMMRLQARKRALFEGILSNNTFHGVKLTVEDIDLFFQPLK